jgi:hypothetical protein
MGGYSSIPGASMTNKCLQFGTFLNASDRIKKIAENATVALRRIAGESSLNSMRLRSRGITPETRDEEENT